MGTRSPSKYLGVTALKRIVADNGLLANGLEYDMSEARERIIQLQDAKAQASTIVYPDWCDEVVVFPPRMIEPRPVVSGPGLIRFELKKPAIKRQFIIRF